MIFILGSIMGILFIAFLMALSFGLTYAVIYLICWCFGIAMVPISWVLGIWLIIELIRKV